MDYKDFTTHVKVLIGSMEAMEELYLMVNSQPLEPLDKLISSHIHLLEDYLNDEEGIITEFITHGEVFDEDIKSIDELYNYFAENF